MRRLVVFVIAAVLTVTAGMAAAYWSTGSVSGGSAAATASSVDQGPTPSVSATGQTITVDWEATTLSSGQAVNGYLVKRYDAVTLAPETILSSCTGTVTATSCVESAVPNGSWKYSVTPLFATNWQGPQSAKSVTVDVIVDPTAPSNALTLSSVAGGAHLSSGNIYYRGVAAGSLRITNAVTDADSGPASSQTHALTGTSTGWTHTPSVVSTPTGGPYVSNAFDWAATTTSGPSETVTGRDVAGNTAVSNLTFINDSTAPSTGSISYADGNQTGLSVAVSFTAGTDDGSGIATRQLQRATASLTGSACDGFGSFANLGPNNPTSAYTDTAVASGVCYMYRYVVTDRVGNQHIATSTNAAKVSYESGVTATAGLISHWRLGEAPVALISTDSFTDTTGTSLGSHTSTAGTTWTRVAGTTAVNSVITDQGRVRRSGAGYTIYTASQTPATADYSVEADFHYRSDLTGDMSGVLGRYNGTTGYLARYERFDQSWNIVKVSAVSAAAYGPAGSYVTAQPLTAGETYRVRLEMSGTATTTVRLLVNGVQKAIWVDSSSPITTAGKAGLYDGNAVASVSKADTGLHLDNLQVSPSTYPRAADNKGPNPGDYKNGPTLGVTGALMGSTNTAAMFDGVNDYVHMTGTTGLPVGASVRSTELWFKTSSAARQVLFAYGTGATAQEYGLWLDAGGTTMTAWGYGNGMDKVFTMPAALNNGVWHHVVKTYNGTSITLYIDGVALTAQAATRSTVIDQWSFAVGAILRTSDGNAGGHFAGSIDEVSFYSTVLDQPTVSSHYQLGQSGGADLAGPTGGSVDGSGLVGTGSRYSTSTALSLVFTKGTDPSGLAATGHELRRATSALTDGACAAFVTYTLVAGGTDPTSPKTDTVADQACYSYQYVVLDTLGNATTYTSGPIKVDTTAPAAPSLAFSAFTNTYWTDTGTTLFYRSAAASGSFTATGATSDAASGIASWAFPALGTNWTSTPGALGVNVYSWTGAPAAPGTNNVTATNNAAGTSESSPFTMTADNTAPTSGTVTYTDTSQTSPSVNVGFTTGTDAASGIGTRLLQRSSATLTGSTCGTYGAFATISGGTNPGSSPVVDTVPTGSCYQYRYVVSDNVGNTDTATSTNVVKVTANYFDTIWGTSSLVSYWRLGEPSGTTMTDSKGTSSGTYFGTPTLGGAGAVAGNTAMQVNGSSQYATAPRPIQDDFSIEFWFKSSQAAGTNCTQWWEGMRLVDAEVAGGNSDFGVSLCQGKIIGGVGSFGDVSIVTPGTYNDNAWHHVVFTRTRTPAAMQLYVDGAFVIAGTPNNTGSLTASTILAFGRAPGGGFYYSGLLDEVAVYSTVLPAPTISAHFAAR